LLCLLRKNVLPGKELLVQEQDNTLLSTYPRTPHASILYFAHSPKPK
jgi:hypothetical protein